MRMMPSIGGLVIALAAGVTHAQQPQPIPPATISSQPSEAAVKLAQRVTVTLTEKRLEEIFTYLKAATGLKLDPLWTNPQFPEGLDRDAVITVEAENLTVTEFIDRVLERTHPEAGDAPTWQLTISGVVQVGPRSRLNRYKRLEIYDVKDLLKEAPDHPNAPAIDLQQALQSKSGSPLKTEPEDDKTPAEKKIQKAQTLDELAKLIRDLIEPEQWAENGGDGASMKTYQGVLIISAPDYIHRQISAATRRKRDAAK